MFSFASCLCVLSGRLRLSPCPAFAACVPRVIPFRFLVLLSFWICLSFCCILYIIKARVRFSNLPAWCPAVGSNPFFFLYPRMHKCDSSSLKSSSRRQVAMHKYCWPVFGWSKYARAVLGVTAYNTGHLSFAGWASLKNTGGKIMSIPSSLDTTTPLTVTKSSYTEILRITVTLTLKCVILLEIQINFVHFFPTTLWAACYRRGH